MQMADLIDGSIGELSLFQGTYEYYAQRVTIKTAVLSEQWQKRLVPFCTPGTHGATALCLEPHDLWVSKAVAGRKKDIAYFKALLERGLVRPFTLSQRVKNTRAIADVLRRRILQRIPPDDA